jgi:hypothetical protein
VLAVADEVEARLVLSSDKEDGGVMEVRLPAQEVHFDGSDFLLLARSDDRHSQGLFSIWTARKQGREVDLEFRGTREDECELASVFSDFATVAFSVEFVEQKLCQSFASLFSPTHSGVATASRWSAYCRMIGTPIGEEEDGYNDDFPTLPDVANSLFGGFYNDTIRRWTRRRYSR